MPAKHAKGREGKPEENRNCESRKRVTSGKDEKEAACKGREGRQTTTGNRSFSTLPAVSFALFANFAREHLITA
jgi:hypothetical protein